MSSTCLHPINLPRGIRQYGTGVHYVTVPCGHCAVCRKERSKAWALRLMLESLYWDETCFVTLTYDDESVPMTDKVAVFDGKVQLPFTLCKEDLTKFFKRLRRRLDKPIKYYACGEYGSHTFRPHYHFIGFGLSQDDIEDIEDAWTKGIVDVGELTMASCNYVAGYVQKKLYGKLSDDYYGFRVKPYSVMSKGLGKRYFMEHLDELLEDECVHYKGHDLALPRYFWTMAEEEFGVNVSEIRRQHLIDRLCRESLDAKRLGLDSVQYLLRLVQLRDSKESALSRAEEMFERGSL